VVSRRAADGSRYVFFFNNSQNAAQEGSVDLAISGDHAEKMSIGCKLEPFGARIFYSPVDAKGAMQQLPPEEAWLPKPVAEPARPAKVPDPITITSARWKVDPGPSNWTPIDPSKGVESIGIYDRRYVYYRATIPAAVPQAMDPKGLSLMATPSGRDPTVAALDGHRLATTRTGRGSNGFDLSSLSLQGGQLTLIYQADGRPNGGEGMEALGGIRGLSITDRSLKPRSLGTWRMKVMNPSDTKAATTVDFNDADSTWITGTPEGGTADELNQGETAVYRAHAKLTADDIKSGLTTFWAGRVDDRGTVYVNGELAGTSENWETPLRLNISKWLHEGDNVIAVVVENANGNGGLGQGAGLINGAKEDLAQLKWEASGEPAGIVGKWWDTDLDDSSWNQAALSGKSSPTSDAAALAWYRLPFELPAADPHVWVPWKVKLDAEGDGFLYLNGHALGRWWQVGPQREYYLPECWLNFGPGAKNVLTLCLRPTDNGSVRSAVVSPYSQFAEQR
jgi:hypothetical protein